MSGWEIREGWSGCSRRTETGQRTDFHKCASMLTIFAIPKPFRGHIGMIQRNAIRSWTLLCPRPQIMLFGNEEGVAEVALEFELQHVPAVSCNEFGTPLLSDVFRLAGRLAENPTQCYVNADIVVRGDFTKAVGMTSSKLERFLIVTKRINLDVMEAMDFSDGWEQTLKEKVAAKGVPDSHRAIDIFAFSEGIYAELPPFAIGRMWFDQWLIKAAVMAHAPVVDVSLVAPVVHQNHEYAHTGGREEIFDSEEGRRNFRFYQAAPHSFTLLSATHELTRSCKLRRLRFRKSAFRAKHLAWEMLVRKTFPLRKRLGLQRRVWTSYRGKATHQLD